MEKWLSISDLSEVTEIPETSVRRYTNKFDKYFRYEKRSRGKKYHPGSIEILKKIAFLYSEDYEAVEIDAMLSQEFPFSVEEETTTNKPPVKSIEQQFEEFKKQQEEFNKQLLEKIQEQQDYIENSIDKREKELMSALNEMQDTKKQIASTKEKKWWQFWVK